MPGGGMRGTHLQLLLFTQSTGGAKHVAPPPVGSLPEELLEFLFRRRREPLLLPLRRLDHNQTALLARALRLLRLLRLHLLIVLRVA